MEAITLEYIKENIEKGIWILVDASDTMKLFTKREFPQSYEEEIKRYKTPSKLVRDGDYFIIYSVTDQDWAGVKKFHKDDFLINDMGGKIVILKNEKRKISLLNTIDEFREIDGSYFEDMCELGNIDYEEVEKYLDIKNQECLPLIRAINF